jgi:hypothetical protein
MKTAERLKRALRNPRLFARGVNRAYHRRGGFRSYNPAGIDVFDEDWDTLVILDACRYDMFEEVNHLEGNLTERISKGSATTEWLKANLDGRDLRDTVYVTANPQFERNREKIDVTFHDVVNVWLDEGWDDDSGTVLAETMTEAGMVAHDRYPQKRIVVHYMQPHFPFVPSSICHDKRHLESINDADDTPDGENIWNKKFLNRTAVSDKDLWRFYNQNLKYVLNYIYKLAKLVNGKLVVTSDHGNFVGERATPIRIREYGHHRGLYDDVAIRVPWLVHFSGDRRDISKGETKYQENKYESDILQNRLNDLGYVE